MSISAAAVVTAVFATSDAADIMRYASMATDHLFPGMRESAKGKDPALGPQVLHAAAKGIDDVSGAIASGRVAAGEAIHDGLSSVPVVGEGLGHVADAAGFVVDGVGGTFYNFGEGIVVGLGEGANMFSMLGGNGYVDFSDIKGLEEVSDEELAKMSETERVRREGIIGYGVNKAIGTPAGQAVISGIASACVGTKRAFDDFSSAADRFLKGEGAGPAPDTRMADAMAQARDDIGADIVGTSPGDVSDDSFMSLVDENSPSWYPSLCEQMDAGKVSVAEHNSILAAYGMGLVTDESIASDFAVMTGAGVANPWSMMASAVEDVCRERGLSTAEFLDGLSVESEPEVEVEASRDASRSDGKDMRPVGTSRYGGYGATDYAFAL